MSVPSPRHRPPPPPPSPTAKPTAMRAWLQRLIRGRRRDVTLTEPVGPVRRWLQRMALPLVALAVVLGLIGGYLYVNGRIHSLEEDRRIRTAARDQQQTELKQQIDDAAEARTRKLELQLCEVIAGARVSPRVEQLRRELRCPAVPSSSAAPAKRPSAPPSGTMSPTAGSTPPGSPTTSPPPPASTLPTPSTSAPPSSSAPPTSRPVLPPLPSCSAPPPCVPVLQRCA